MILNFIKVTLRTLYHEKVYASLNIVGLSIAIACCIILGLYIHSELTYDRSYIKHRQIYRVIKYNVFEDEGSNNPFVSQQLGSLLKNDFHEVLDSASFVIARPKHLFRYEGEAFYWDNTLYADNSVFNVFTHKIIYGDPASALIDASSIAVSESFSRKYFGDENPVGKLIEDDVSTYKISLVFEDLPENTSRKYDVLLSQRENELKNKDDFRKALDILYGYQAETYLLMPEGYNPDDFDKVSQMVYDRYVTGDYLKSRSQDWKIWIQPLSEIHLDKQLYGLRTVHYYLYGFLAVTVFILIVACINYINLAVARAAKRAKEVGLRKVLGSGRKSLIMQFTGESVFFSLVALFLGLVLAEACLRLTNLNDLIGKTLSLNFIAEPAIFFWMLVISIVFGFISGLYPAFYLSSIKSVSSVTTGFKAGKYSARLREGLVLIQFIISVCIIACTLLMFLQMHYITTKPLGFEKENRLMITLQGADLIDKVPVLKNELAKSKNIFGAAFCSSIIGRSSGGFMFNEGEMVARYNTMDVDNDFIKVMGIDVISGKDFSHDNQEGFIVNETLVKKLGWGTIGDSYYPNANLGKLLGVVKDFHHYPLHNAIDSFVFKRFKGTEETLSRIREGTSEEKRTSMIGYLILNINSANTPGTIKYIEETYEKFDPVHPIEFEFLDDVLNKMYLSEKNLMELIGVFASVCIFISCLGLFGLTAFSTEQRTKEIGTRKVLGATTWQIISMFSTRILLLVLGSSVFASLGAYYVMDEWLSRFAFKIDIEIWVFLASAAVVALLAFVAITSQAARAARSNPVEALRYE